MSTYNGRDQVNTYGDMFHIENSNNGFDSTLRVVESGTGTASSFQLSTISAQFTGTLGVTGVASFDVTPNVNGDTIWHAGNDGAGSGLDADTVDGFEASAIPIGTRNVNVTGTWDWQTTLTFTNATSVVIQRDVQSDGSTNEMATRHEAEEYQWFPSPGGVDQFTSRMGYDYTADIWRFGGEGIGLDNGSNLTFRNAADSGFITAFSISGADAFTVGAAGSAIDVIGSSVTINGNAVYALANNEFLTGDEVGGTARNLIGVDTDDEAIIGSTSIKTKMFGLNDRVTIGGDSSGGEILGGIEIEGSFDDALARVGFFSGESGTFIISSFENNADIDVRTTGSGQFLVNGSPVGGFDMANNEFLTGQDTGGTPHNLVGVDASNLLQIGNATGPSAGVQLDTALAFEVFAAGTRMIRIASGNTFLYDPSHGRVLQTQDPTNADNISGIHVEDASNVLRPVGFADRSIVLSTASGNVDLTKEQSVQTIYVESGTPTFVIPAFDGDHLNGGEWWIYNETANQVGIDPRENGNTMVYLDGSTGEQGGLYLNNYGWAKITKKADNTYFARGVGLEIPIKLLDNATNTNTADLDIREVNDSGAETDSSGFESIAAFSTFQRGSGTLQLEVFIDQAGTAQAPGLIDDDATLTSGAYPGSATVGSDSLSYHSNGTVYSNLDGSGEVQDTAPASYTTGDYIQIVADFTNDSIDFYKNGVLQSQVDITGITFNGGLTPALTCNGSGSRSTLNLAGPFNNTIAGASAWA